MTVPLPTLPSKATMTDVDYTPVLAATMACMVARDPVATAIYGDRPDWSDIASECAFLAEQMTARVTASYGSYRDLCTARERVFPRRMPTLVTTAMAEAARDTMLVFTEAMPKVGQYPFHLTDLAEAAWHRFQQTEGLTPPIPTPYSSDALVGT